MLLEELAEGVSRQPATQDAGRPHTRSGAFRPDIEGLRGIAILLVVLFHAGIPVFRGGFLGVDVFFVLSGYLITGLLSNEVLQTGRLRFVEFYARRVRRLLPAAICALLVTILAAKFVYTPMEQAFLAHTARATAAYISNFWFMRQASDYFAQDTKSNPLLHTWSLAVEEQFYLVWPFVIMLALRIRRSRGGLAVALFLASSASIASFVYLARLNPPFAFFGMPVRAWEFGLGGIASLIPAEKVRMSGSAGRIAAWIGLGGVLLSGCLLDERTALHSFGVAIPVVCTAIVLIAGATWREQGANKLLSVGALQGLGRLSYSWYLWHWPALVMMLVLFPGMSIAGRSLCLLGSLGLAAVVHKTLENPIRFNPFLVKRPALCLLLAAASTILCFLICMGWLRQALRDPEDRVFAKAKVDLPRLYTQGCQADLTEAKPKECVFGDQKSPKTAVLFGDSHAAQWFPPLEQMASAHAWRLVTLTKSGCPAAGVAIFNYQLNRSMPECAVWREAALKRIEQIKPSLVIMGSSGIYVDGSDRTTGISAPNWRDGTRKTLSRLSSAGISVLLIRNSPEMGFDVPICLSRLARHRTDTCAASRPAALPADITQAESEALTGIRGVSDLEISDRICNSDVCPAVVNGLVVYRDADHLTASFAKTLTPLLESRIAPLMNPESNVSHSSIAGAR